MTLKELFLYSQNPAETYTYFLPDDVTVDIESSKYFLHLLGYKKILMPGSSSYSIQNVPAYFFIYTYSGSGTYQSSNVTSLLTSGTFFLGDCRKSHTLSTSTFWEYEVLYFDGYTASFYFQQLPSHIALFQTHHADTLLKSAYKQLFQMASTNPDTFLIHKLLTDILTRAVQETKLPEPPAIPLYLADIKKEFDSNYFTHFCLDQLEASCQVNKYRLCKEFKLYYDMSPIQYLHYIRIQNAQILLQDTTMKIHEIGYQVGYENVNHFIHHFKKLTGSTPAAYRK